MKLSAFIAVSVPLLAMSQAPAMAEDAMADTGSWLKSSLATLKPEAKATTKPAPRKVSHAMPALSDASLNVRPFVPGRYLPHESDLRRAMVSQQGQYDNSTAMDPTGSQQQLAGEVNASGYAQRSPASYDRYSMMTSLAQDLTARVARTNKRGATRSPRVMPGQMPMVPEQLTPMQAAVQPMIPEPPAQRMATRPQFSMPMSPSMQQPSMQQSSMQQEQAQMMQQMQQMQPPMGRQPQMQQSMMQPQQPRTYMQPGYATANGPPQLTSQEQQALERMVAQNRPTAYMDFNGDIYGSTQGNPQSGTGPSPLPMNLMQGSPMQALNQSRRQAHVPQARFGSWHGGDQLPESGFHSYVQHRQTHFFECTLAPQAHPSHKNNAHKSNKTTIASAPSQARNVQPPRQQSKAKPVLLATYPAYTSGHGLAY
jgi:hypothetical protein